MIYSGQDVIIHYNDSPIFVFSNPEPKGWISYECDDLLINRAIAGSRSLSGTISIEFDKDGSSLAFLQELQGRCYKSDKQPEYYKYSYQKQCLVGVKLLRSKSKQSRIVAVVVNC